MNLIRTCAFYFLITGFLITGLQAQSIKNPTVDREIVEKFIEEGIERSQVMDFAWYLTDVYGPRLTNSPQMRRANEYTRKTLEEMGLKNAVLYEWGEFGRGWELERFALHAKTPYSYFPVTAFPKAWSPGARRPVSGKVVVLDVMDEDLFTKHRGKLRNVFVMLQEPAESERHWSPLATRHDSESLLRMANAAGAPQWRGGGQNPDARARAERTYEVLKFLESERVAAILDYSYRGWLGQIAVASAVLPAHPDTPWAERQRPHQAGAPDPVNQISLTRDHYNRIHRLVSNGFEIELEMDFRATYHTRDLKGYNTIAEIPGTDPDLKDEIVMIGAHLDSWHAGTGASDNASGSAVMMEAMRILKATGVQPRRTIRIALWDAEEQGLHGSLNYVRREFADRDPETGELKATSNYDNFSAYYNFDNGSGQIRGIYLQQNEQLRPLFRTWLTPFADWGTSTVTYQNTTGTDHLSFDRVGLPGFQFIQEPLEYFTLTHHSNLDTYERLEPMDLMRSAVIIATIVYHTAQLDEKLPRKENVQVTR